MAARLLLSMAEKKYKGGVSSSGMMFKLSLMKIRQLSEEFIWDEHTNGHVDKVSYAYLSL
jgi:hypothetical protein